MNIVFISDCEPFNVHVIRAVQQQRPVRAILRVVSSRRKMSTQLEKLRRAPLRSLTRYAERLLFYNRLRRRIETEGSYHLFGSARPPAIDDCEIINVPNGSINAPRTVELLRSLAPDVLVTSWAPLLKPEVYETARLAALNVHWGIAPAYRGQDSVFWAMYFGDYSNLGVTIHHLDKGIDTGPVLAHGYPPISERESEASLLAKNAQVASELLTEFFDAVDQQPSGRSMRGSGRLFNVRDRRLWHDARFWFRRNFRQAPLPTRPGSKAIYFGGADS